MKTFTAKVLKHRSGLEGDFGRITSKELGEYIGKTVKVRVEEIKKDEA